MTMSPVFIIALLLISAAVVESSVEQTEEEDFTSELKHHVRKGANHREEKILLDGAFPGSCRACQWVVSKVEKLLGKDSSKEKIDQLLNKACNGIKISLVRWACNKIVQKFKSKLIEPIANHEGSRVVCVKVKLCKAAVLKSYT